MRPALVPLTLRVSQWGESEKRPWLEAVMRSSRIAGIALGATLAVTGLAGCGKFYWGQPNATQEQWDRDNRECMTEGAPSPTAAQYGIVYEGFYRACLSGRGWKREQFVNPPPGWFRGIE
jgi:hypothetical protein